MYVYSITSDTWLSCMLSFCSLTPNCELLFKDAQKLLWVIVWKSSDVQRLGWSNISGHPQDVTICPLCSVLGKPQTRFSAVLHKHAMWSLETYISEAMNTSVRLQICCFLHFYVTLQHMMLTFFIPGQSLTAGSKLQASWSAISHKLNLKQYSTFLKRVFSNKQHKLMQGSCMLVSERWPKTSCWL